MKINKMSRKELYAVAKREGWSTPIECSSLVLLPPQSTALHDSGYRLMDAVACLEGEPICRVSGCSDVFHLAAPSTIRTKERTPHFSPNWNIDCLARSGLFNVFVHDCLINVGAAMSSLYLHPIMKVSEDA